jgi:hypothetical protein
VHSWFSSFGKALPDVDDRKQIRSWEEWPGPEDESVSAAHLRQQALQESVLAESNQNRSSLEKLWQRIQEVVVQASLKKVLFDPNKDSWHAPNAAVWHAAWTAGLIGLFLMSKKTIPEDLQVQWMCFKSGHWPCGWEGELPKGCQLSIEARLAYHS